MRKKWLLYTLTKPSHAPSEMKLHLSKLHSELCVSTFLFSGSTLWEIDTKCHLRKLRDRSSYMVVVNFTCLLSFCSSLRLFLGVLKTKNFEFECRFHFRFFFSSNFTFLLTSIFHFIIIITILPRIRLDIILDDRISFA